MSMRFGAVSGASLRGGVIFGVQVLRGDIRVLGA